MEKSIKDSKPRPKTWLLGTSWHGLDVQKMDFSTWIFPALLSWCFDIINWIEMAVCREQKEGLDNVINVSPKVWAIFSSDSLVMSMESAMSSRVVSVGHWLRKLVRTNRKEYTDVSWTLYYYYYYHMRDISQQPRWCYLTQVSVGVGDVKSLKFSITRFSAWQYWCCRHSLEPVKSSCHPALPFLATTSPASLQSSGAMQ